MPITRRGGKYYWGSKGPFASRKKAEDVARAAHASGYQEDTMATVTGTTAGGATMRSSLQKENGGNSSGAATVFTVDTSGYNETYNERDPDNKNRKKKSGIDRAYTFLVDGTPTLKSLDAFMEKVAGTQSADNLESKNRMNNPRRLDWRKIKKGPYPKEGNMNANRVPSEEDPSHANQPIPRKKPREYGVYMNENQKKLVVNADKGNPNLKQPDEHKIAQQKDMEERAKVWDKERKKKGGDQEGPPLEQGAAAAQDLHMMEKGFAGGYYPDALSRGGPKDKIGRRDDEKEAEEEDIENVKAYLKAEMPSLYKMLDFSDVP